MPVRQNFESHRPLRAKPLNPPISSSSGNLNSSGSGSGQVISSFSCGTTGGPNKSGTLGPPDVYPQDAGQKEDELTAVHVKQGFTQSYSALVSDEYASANNKMASLALTKVLAELKTIQMKKEEANTFPDTGKRRQSLNTKDHFWLVTGRNKMAVDNWFKDLSGSKPLAVLAKKVPVFNKREELLMTLSENQVPLARAVWFLKMTAAYALAMQETNKTKKKQVSDPSIEWTLVIVRFLKDQLGEITNVLNGNSSSVSSGQLTSVGGGSEDVKPETIINFKYWTYVTKLCEHMYHMGLLDRQEFLQWILDMLEKYRYPDDPIVRLILTLVIQYSNEFAKSELLSRKLAHNCAKKIAILVNDTDAVYNMTANDNATSPVMAAFLELMDDSYTRFLIFGFSAVVQTITMKCPTAMVWNYFGENKTPSSLNGSPLDLLPNAAPSGLPMPPRQNNQSTRHKIKQAELAIKDRSLAAEAKWSGNHGLQNLKNINVILPILETLDSYVFERVDSSNNCLDTLYTNLFSSEDPTYIATLIHTLCEWAVTSNRSGEHRAFVVAKILEQRQSDLMPNDTETGNGSQEDKEENQTVYNGPPIFQNLLFSYLDIDAPTVQKKQEFSNLVLLFYELICHDVFSHDSYICQLISRGDIGSLSNNAKNEEGKEDADGSMEDSKINDDLANILSQIKEGNQLSDPFSPPNTGPSVKAIDLTKSSRHMQYCYHFPLPPSDETTTHDSNQRHVMLFGAGRGKDEASKNVKKICKDILKLFSKKSSIDVSEGGKVKKNSKNEVIFENVVQSFQCLSYFDQQTVTHQCGTVVMEMLSAFGNGTANYLPVAEHISFLMDLAGLALNIQEILDWSMQILKELPGVEVQLMERGSCLTRNYTTTLALYVVGVLRRYHSIVVLAPTDVVSIFDQFLKIAYKPKLPSENGDRRTMLDCNSAEWCILAYLYDLSCNCSFLKTREKFSELKRLFSPFIDPSVLNFVLTDRKFGIDYIANPKKHIDPLTIKLLIENPQNQYNLVCNVLMEVCECNDNDKLNDIAILCCEFTAQCNALSSEWLGAFAALSNAGGSNGYPDLISQVAISDQAIYNRLGTFASILIARHCFHLQSFVVSVAIPSLLKAWEEVKEGQASKETEIGARLSCHLLLKLFQSVDSFQSMFFSIGSPVSRATSHSSGIKYSCDRHLLSSAHRNITVGAIIAVLKAILVLGDAENKPLVQSSSSMQKILGNFEEDDFGLGLGMGGAGRMEGSSLSEFAKHTLKQICHQDWVRDRCLQVPDDLLKNGTLLDRMLSPKQAQKLLRLICYRKIDPMLDSECEQSLSSAKQKHILTNILNELDEWDLRISAVDIRLMYHQLSSNGSSTQDINVWLDQAASSIVSMFNAEGHDATSKEESPAKKKGPIKRSPTLLIPYLIKHLKFLQTLVLKASGVLLEEGNWSRSSKSKLTIGKESSFSHHSFLQMILTCLKELDADCKDKKDRNDKEEQKEYLLQSIYTQLQTYLCFDKGENIYNYEDPMARKLMQDSLQLRFSLVGGMFETIYKNITSITDWATLFVQFIARGVVDLTKNSDLFLTVLDMLTTLIHSTLISDGGTSQSERSEENRKHHSYHTLVKKLKKEIGDANNPSINFLRQLLPLPKVFLEAIVSEQFGTVTDGKGNKTRGPTIDKKHGMQVSDKQRVNPWDILEGQRNPAPLSWTWFGAVRSERKASRYEESFCELRYATNALEKPPEYYLDPPPLPAEDLEPQQKPSKEGDKNTNQNQNNIMNAPQHPNQMPMMNMGRGGNMMPMMGGNQMMSSGMMMRDRNGMPIRGPMMNPMMGGRGGPGMMGGGPMMNNPGMSQNMYRGNMMAGGVGGSGNPNWSYGSHGGMQQQPQSHMQGMGYGNQPGYGGNMQHMQQMNSAMSGPGSQRFPMSGPPSNSKQALQNMLRARHPGPSQFFSQGSTAGNTPMVPGGNQQFLQPRSGYPIRPNMRMQQSQMYPGGPQGGMDNSGSTMGSMSGGTIGSVGATPGPSYSSGNMSSGSQYGFSNQMGGNGGAISSAGGGMNQYMMRQNSSGSGFGGGQQQQQQQINNPNMMNRQQQMMQMNQGGSGGYMRGGMQGGNMQGNYNMGMSGGGGGGAMNSGYRQQQPNMSMAGPSQVMGNNQMRMSGPGMNQQQQMMMQQQRGSQQQQGGQMNYQQNMF